jgi:hypothetical protein
MYIPFLDGGYPEKWYKVFLPLLSAIAKVIKICAILKIHLIIFHLKSHSTFGSFDSLKNVLDNFWNSPPKKVVWEKIFFPVKS